MADATINPLLQAALDYARRGWPVLPCHTPEAGGCSCGTRDCASVGKHPRTPRGLKDATGEEATIRAWWGRWPSANVAIITGRRSGLVVVDVDITLEKRGDESLKSLARRHGPLPDTTETVTGSGGRHLLFAHPGDGEEVRNAVELAGLSGLDVRGDAGYIIAPPSLHANGQHYVWEAASHPDDLPVAPLPAWLLALITKPTVPPTNAAPASAELASTIFQGRRNQTLTSLAGTMRRKGMAEAAILAALQVENAARCVPPLPDADLRRIAASVSRYAPASAPGSHPIGIEEITGDTIVWVDTTEVRALLTRHGITEVVALPAGLPHPARAGYERAFAWLAAYEPRLTAVTRHIMAHSATAAGDRAQRELVRRLGPERCWQVQWSSECETARQVVDVYGPEVLVECLQHASPWPVAGIVTVAELSDGIDRLYQEGFPRGVSPGWKSLEEYYTVRPGEFTVVTGIPGHGKTGVVSAMVVAIAAAQGWAFALCSPESQPLERYAARLIELHAGAPLAPDAHPRLSREALQAAKAWLGDHVCFLLPEIESPTVAHLLELARVQVFRRGIRGLVLDPWNELDHSRPPHLLETEYISQALSQIRRFARQHGVHVWLVAHPIKLVKDKDGQYPVATAYDISGSAHWHNKADNILTVWRHVKARDGRVEVHIQKIRFREIGRIGKVDLIFDPRTGRFTEDGAWTYPSAAQRRQAQAAKGGRQHAQA